MSHWIMFPEDIAYVEVIVLEPGQSLSHPEGKHWVRVVFKNYEWLRTEGSAETSRSDWTTATPAQLETEMLEIVTDLKQPEEVQQDD